jgi:hypothetical protein
VHSCVAHDCSECGGFQSRGQHHYRTIESHAPQKTKLVVQRVDHTPALQDVAERGPGITQRGTSFIRESDPLRMKTRQINNNIAEKRRTKNGERRTENGERVIRSSVGTYFGKISFVGYGVASRIRMNTGPNLPTSIQSHGPFLSRRRPSPLMCWRGTLTAQTRRMGNEEECRRWMISPAFWRRDSPDSTLWALNRGSKMTPCARRGTIKLQTRGEWWLNKRV